MVLLLARVKTFTDESGNSIVRKLSFRLALSTIACAGLVTFGCTPPAAVEPTSSNTSSNTSTNKPPMAADELEHAHEGDHVHAETYPEAVAMVDGLREKIRDAFAKGEGMSADEAVHEIGHVLEDMAMLAKKASLSEADQVSVGTAVESLLDAFEKIDEKLHGGDGVDYDAVAAEIDAALVTLKKFTGETK